MLIAAHVLKKKTLVYLTAFYLQAIVFVCFCSLISDKTLYLNLTECLHLSVFICIVSLCYEMVFTCGNMGTKESKFPGEIEPVWANPASTFCCLDVGLKRWLCLPVI